MVAVVPPITLAAAPTVHPGVARDDGAPAGTLAAVCVHGAAVEAPIPVLFTGKVPKEDCDCDREG